MVGYVGNVIHLKFVQERFKVLSEKELVKTRCTSCGN